MAGPYSGFRYKPAAQGAVGGGRAAFLFTEEGGNKWTNASIYSADGKTLLERLTANRGPTEPGTKPAVKFSASKYGAEYGPSFIVRVQGADGKTTDYNIANSQAIYDGVMGDPSSLKDITAQANAGGGGAGGAYAPGQYGQYGYYPAYVGGMFPSPILVNYSPIKTAPYKFTDPMEFAQKYGDFNRGEIAKNAAQANDLALKELDTELAGMKSFVPAAAALQRSQVSLDNEFNQQQRTSQVDTAMPGARADLEAQAGRARSYAEGRIPDAVQDRALELNTRSRAADMASAGGFGATSSVARKASDLMSAEQRVQLSQYGDQLLTSNISNKAALELAPTEYANAGSQVRVMPTLSGSQLAAQNLSEANNLNTISAQNAFTGTVQQQQFSTSLEQNTRQFNASNKLQAGEFNANNQNQFALTKFQYEVGYAGSVAGAAQTNANTVAALQQQAMASQIYQNGVGAAQSAGQAGAIAQGAGAMTGFISSINGLINSLGGGGGSTGNSSNDYDNPNSDLSSAPIVTPESVEGSNNYVPTTDTGEVVSAPQAAVEGPSSSGVSTSSVSQDTPTTTANVDSGGPVEVRSFYQDTGISPQAQSQVTRDLMSSGSTVLSTAGLNYNQSPGMTNVGYSQTGRAMFSYPSLATSSDTSMGSKLVQGISKSIDPTGAFSREDASTFDQIATVAGDVNLLTQLGAQYAAKDTKGFIDTLLQRVVRPVAQGSVDDPQSKAGIAAAFNAYQLFTNWDKMSAAQKSLGVAALGILGYRTATGHNLGSIPIIKPVFGADGKTIVTPGLNVGQALNMLNMGINAYSVIKNWDQLNTIQKVAAGTGMASDLAALGKQFNLLGSGVNGSAVSIESANTISSMLSTGEAAAASHFGVGAVTVSAGSKIPTGYTAIATAKDGSTVIIPTANAGTSAVDVLGYTAGAAAIAAGTYQVYKGWGEGGTKGAVNGLLGGSGIAAGLYALEMSSWAGPAAPFIAAGVIAASVLGDSIHTGKSKAQGSRDSYRDFLSKAGVTDKNANVLLSDGSVFNIGVDGHGGRHSAAHPELLAGDQKAGGSDDRSGNNKLNAWDVDYTNDLDYTASMGTNALMRILTGGKKTGSEQIGAELANAMIGNIGYGQQMNQGNYEKLVANLRGLYSKSGIKDKNSAYQLANQAYAEGRINDTDLIAAQQAFNLIYDKNSYTGALKLMSGRNKGVEVAAGARPPVQVSGSESLNNAPQLNNSGIRPPVNMTPGSASFNGTPLVPYSSTKSPANIGQSLNGFTDFSTAARQVASSIGQSNATLLKRATLASSKEAARLRNKQMSLGA